MTRARGPQLRRAAAGLVLVMAAAAAGHADRYEARWSARPVGGVAVIQEEGAGAELAPAGGVSIAMAYGLTNRLDLKVELLGMLAAPTFHIPAMRVLGYTAEGALERRTSSATLLLGPMWRFGSPDRWTPVLALAGGGGLRHRSNGILSALGITLPGKEVVTTVDLAISSSVGVERRLGRRLTFGAYASVLAAGSRADPFYAVASLSMGFSYVHYPLW